MRKQAKYNVDTITSNSNTMVKHFSLMPFQWAYYNSISRFPMLKAGWASGKTMSMILKAVTLSKLYSGNKGLILRKTERSLRDSTMADFEDYTPWRIPRSDPRVVVPGTGSEIIFTHADDMKSLQTMLQNVNLGWAAIEQADELVSPLVFDMLRGRLRRVLTPTVEVQEKLLVIGALDKIVDDFRDIPNKPPHFKRDKAVKAIIEELHQPYHQLCCIANACGHNWIWRRWKKEPLPGYALFEATSFDNAENIPADTLEDWERLKYENPKRYARYVMNSDDDYNVEGAYYAELMNDAMHTGRTDIDTLYNMKNPVYTYWDLGVRASDTTAIWFVQFAGNEIWLIDFFESHGKGMDWYSHELDTYPYVYAAHYLPPDAVARQQSYTITTRLNILRKLRREPVRLVERHRVEERIASVRVILNRCKFASKCNRGVEALLNYRCRTDTVATVDDTPVVKPLPVHDVNSNAADSFGYMAVSIRNRPPDADIVRCDFDECETDDGVYDLLSL